MKTYTVKEISEILNTNPETVRRWIRDGKLVAPELVTRKGGNTVTEEALKDFLKERPKYARIASATSALLPGNIGIPIAIGALVSSVLLEIYGNKKLSETKVQPEEFKAQLNKLIDEHESNILNKENNIAQLKSEIQSERKKVADLRRLMENVDFSERVVDDTETK